MYDDPKFSPLIATFEDIDVGIFAKPTCVTTGLSRVNDCARLPTSVETVRESNIELDCDCSTGLVSPVLAQVTIDDVVHAVVKHHTDDPAARPDAPAVAVAS